jgi:16S rRNA (guanine(966)-N(2))-methyltransferase RsmD
VTPRSRPKRSSLGSAPHRVRIIGGKWRRTPLDVPDIPGLRPTPDRVRETLFNWIGHLMPDLAHVKAIDLFAGTGALGFELASRGAEAVILVETHPVALRQLQATLERLDADRVEIVAGDAFAVASRQASASFDLVFLDPPFDSGLGGPGLTAARRLVSAQGLVYYEAGSALTREQAIALDFDIVRDGRAGRVAFHLLRPTSA